MLLRGILLLFLVGFQLTALAEEPETIQLDDVVVERRAMESAPGLEPFGAVKANVELWEDGVLPVEFAAEISNQQKALFFDACHDWERVANVHCVEGRYKDRALELTQMSLGCWSLWGMGTHFLVARRRMNLEDPGCWERAKILHELGHAFGLIHEHQRPDRDRYIEIHHENVESGFFWANLIVNFWTQGATMVTPYDFLSIMHYGRDAFSKNGLDTIVPRDPFKGYLGIIGNAETLSAWDAATMRFLYGPPKIKNDNASHY